MKWDGEWQITYETFRDMGIAFAVAMLLIYLLIVGQFQSFLTPLIIMAPIPLTLIGILPGHWLTESYLTAPSIIGFIALAGIIVRNSILLVDFIQLQERAGIPLLEAVIKAGVIRTRPILLTAAALMVGAFVIILDPIFQGLAVSLLFGVGASTLLTLFVIPLLYYRIVGQTVRSGRPSVEIAMVNGEAVTHRVRAEGVSVRASGYDFLSETGFSTCRIWRAVMVLLQRIRDLRLTIGLLVVSFCLPCFDIWGGTDGVISVAKPTRSGFPELRLGLRDAIQAAIDNNINLRLLKERIAAAQAQADASLGALLPNVSGYENGRTKLSTLLPYLDTLISYESPEYPDGPLASRFLTQSSFNQRSSHSRPAN